MAVPLAYLGVRATDRGWDGVRTTLWRPRTLELLASLRRSGGARHGDDRRRRDRGGVAGRAHRRARAPLVAGGVRPPVGDAVLRGGLGLDRMAARPRGLAGCLDRAELDLLPVRLSPRPRRPAPGRPRRRGRGPLAGPRAVVGVVAGDAPPGPHRHLRRCAAGGALHAERLRGGVVDAVRGVDPRDLPLVSRLVRPHPARDPRCGPGRGVAARDRADEPGPAPRTPHPGPAASRCRADPVGTVAVAGGGRGRGLDGRHVRRAPRHAGALAAAGPSRHRLGAGGRGRPHHPGPRASSPPSPP